jgi:hypothetical protein
VNTSREQILLDQRFGAVIDALEDSEILRLARALDEEMREGLASLIGFPITAYDDDAALLASLRARSNRRMSSYNVGIVLGDACVQKCIEALGDSSEDPTLEDLQGVLPNLIDEFGLGATQLMVVQYSLSLRGFKELIGADDRFKPKQAVLSMPVREVDQAAQEAKRAARRERQKAQKAKKK